MVGNFSNFFNGLKPEKQLKNYCLKVILSVLQNIKKVHFRIPKILCSFINNFHPISNSNILRSYMCVPNHRADRQTVI